MARHWSWSQPSADSIADRSREGLPCSSRKARALAAMASWSSFRSMSIRDLSTDAINGLGRSAAGQKPGYDRADLRRSPAARLVDMRAVAPTLGQHDAPALQLEHLACDMG